MIYHHDPAESGSLMPPTVDDDPSLSAHNLSSTKLYYQTFGNKDKKPVIVLHGGSGKLQSSKFNISLKSSMENLTKGTN